MVVGFPEYKPIHIAGPYMGRENDSGIWPQTDIVNFLKDNGFYVLGDKGYIGCEQVYSMKKKRRGEVVLSAESKEYNRSISQYRVRVENYFAKLKVWKVLSYVYRGNLQDHRKIFMVCVVLLFLAE